LDTLILTTDIWIWSGAHSWCDQSAEDAYSSMVPDPTFAFVGGPWCPTLDFVIAFWIMIYLSHIVHFAILYLDGTLIARRYVDEILQPVLVPLMQQNN
jgi:hypothetical protein